MRIVDFELKYIANQTKLNIWEAHLGRDFLGEQEQQHQQMDEGSSKQGFVLQVQSDGSTSQTKSKQQSKMQRVRVKCLRRRVKRVLKLNLMMVAPLGR